ncbi:hypothetical protein D3C72_1533640 [compost metagenome]
MAPRLSAVRIEGCDRMFACPLVCNARSRATRLLPTLTPIVPGDNAAAPSTGRPPLGVSARLP